jgi:molybdopterin synthase catalytic subunit
MGSDVKEPLMIDEWVSEVKHMASPEELGMILIHHGIVRASSKSGRPVRGMKLSYDQEKLDSVIPVFKQKPGIVEIKVWINTGSLEIGDTIMLLLVAGRFRTDVLPVFDELLSLIKREIVSEKEIR